MIKMTNKIEKEICEHIWFKTSPNYLECSKCHIFGEEIKPKTTKEEQICENCGKNRNKHNSKWRSYNGACKRFQPKNLNVPKNIYKEPHSQEKKDNNEVQDVVLSGVTKHEEGKTMNTEHMPLNVDNHPDKLTPQTKPKCMVTDCKNDAVKYVNDGKFWIRVCMEDYVSFRDFAEQNNLKFKEEEIPI